MLRSLQVVYATGAELEGQRDRTPLGELVCVQAEREPVPSASLEITSRLGHLERTALQEDVGGSGQDAASGSTSWITNSTYSAALSNSGGTVYGLRGRSDIHPPDCCVPRRGWHAKTSAPSRGRDRSLI